MKFYDLYLFESIATHDSWHWLTDSIYVQMYCWIWFCWQRLDFRFFMASPHCWLPLLTQDHGSPSKNGLGHKETVTVHPVTRQKVKAVFIPKHKQGRWSGELSVDHAVESEKVIDDDTQALRANQLQLDLTGLNYRMQFHWIRAGLAYFMEPHHTDRRWPCHICNHNSQSQCLFMSRRSQTDVMCSAYKTF